MVMTINYDYGGTTQAYCNALLHSRQKNQEPHIYCTFVVGYICR